MKKRKIYLVLLCAAVLLLSSEALVNSQAPQIALHRQTGAPFGTVDLTPTDDSLLRANAPDEPGGIYSDIGIRNGSFYDEWSVWSVIKFDLTSVTGYDVTSATLHLYYEKYETDNPAGRPFTMHRFLGDWNENTLTWNNKPATVPTISASTNCPSNTGVWVTWDVTSDVHNFASGQTTNYGWTIEDETFWSGYNIPIAYFLSKESPSNTPYLEVTVTGNLPPNKPTNPTPADGANNIPLTTTLQWTGSDPDQDSLTYNVYFGTTSPPSLVANNISTASYSPGKLAYSKTYYWMIVAWDNQGHSTAGPVWQFKTAANQPPTTPTINGPSTGKKGKSYAYTFIAVDPEHTNLTYEIDWGDGQTEQVGPVASDTLVSRSHVWQSSTNFTIKCRAKDADGANSAWGSLTVTMPYIPQPPLLQFLERLLSRFPHAFPILRELLGY